MEKWEKNVCAEWARLNLLEEAGVRIKPPSRSSGAPSSTLAFGEIAPGGLPAGPRKPVINPTSYRPNYLNALWWC